MALSHGISQHGLGDELFDRRCQLVVAPPLASTGNGTSPQAIGISDLRMTFAIQKKRGSKPNPAEIVVYNLAESSRALMQSKGSRVILQAGYATAIGTVFFGDSLKITHSHEGPNWVTRITAADGSRAHQHARVKESVTGGAKVGDAFARLATSMGLSASQGVVAQLNSAKAFEHGWAAHGRAAPEMTRLLKAVGFEWSVQDGDLIVNRIGAAQSDVVSIDEDSGLIGTPEHVNAEKPGKPAVIKFRTLLRHGLRPGCKIDLSSRRFGGLCRLLKVDHNGDTDGGPWYSDCESEIIG